MPSYAMQRTIVYARETTVSVGDKYIDTKQTDNCVCMYVRVRTSVCIIRVFVIDVLKNIIK